jgi:hypothetical protein
MKNKLKNKAPNYFGAIGGEYRIRTDDPLTASQVL